MIKIIFTAILLISYNYNTGSGIIAGGTTKNMCVPFTRQPGVATEKATLIRTAEKSIQLIPHRVHLQKGIDFDLNIPEGYNVSLAAQGMKRLRFMAKSPDGRLFATDMYDKSDNRKGRVLIFSAWNDSTKKFSAITTWLGKLHNPNQVAFYDKYIYVAETDKLSRYMYTTGELKPTSAAQVIATFPDYGLSYKYGGWHLTRSMAFFNNKLYVSVGSSCNACVEKEEIRAAIVEMNPDGTDKKFFARGLRNSVALKWVNDKLWVTSMGRDLIGPDKPEDLFLPVEREGYYGWPFYFQYHNAIYADDQFRDSVRAPWVKKPPLAFCGFKAHSAPLGFEFMKNFADETLQNNFLVCLHGSTSVGRQRGNAIVKVIGSNKYVDIINGFLTGKTEKDRHGRPCDILMNDTNSFFFTDDLNGILYFVWK